MEETLKILSETAGLALEMVVVLVVLVGGLRAIVLLAGNFVQSRLSIRAARAIWVDFAAAILLSLEFALGADIIRTAIAPTWDDIGQLAAIAAIRTGLGFFLGRDIQELGGHPLAEERPE